LIHPPRERPTKSYVNTKVEKKVRGGNALPEIQTVRLVRTKQYPIKRKVIEFARHRQPENEWALAWNCANSARRGKRGGKALHAS